MTIAPLPHPFVYRVKVRKIFQDPLALLASDSKLFLPELCSHLPKHFSQGLL